jgi:hypothetical protein
MVHAMEIAAPCAHIPSTPHSPIRALPPELLLIIFKFVYVASRRSVSPITPTCRNAACLAENKCFCYRLPDEKYEWDTSGDSHPTTLFPNSLVSVCSHWGKIVLLEPVFWTRVVIILDSTTFPPPGLTLQLDSAGDQPIDIVVTRTAKSNTEDSDVEKSRMAYIMTALRPHFRRCRKLRFDVVHSSSLPRLRGSLPPVMPDLQELSLNSCVDSGHPAILPYDHPREALMVNWKSLNSLVIDGWNFADLLEHVPSPSTQVFPICELLAIKFGGEGFPFERVSELLRSTSIASLTVDSVLFSQRKDLNFDYALKMGTLVLKNLRAALTNIILSSFDDTIDFLEINNCSASEINEMPTAYKFTLRDIGVDQSLGRFIQTWSGPKLRVIDCVGFDDEVLEMMCEADECGYFPARLMEELHISQCNNFLLGSLQQFILVRNNPHWTQVECSPLLSTLWVDARFPLPETDICWFSDWVEHFQWRNASTNEESDSLGIGEE